MIAGPDHVNIRCRDLAASIAFYRDVLGMRVGPVAGMADEPRAWVYGDDGHPILHVGHAPGDPGTATGGGAVDHVAFASTGRDALLARLIDAGHAPATNEVPAAGLRQVFAHDPHGVLLELNFREATS